MQPSCQKSPGFSVYSPPRPGLPPTPLAGNVLWQQPARFLCVGHPPVPENAGCKALKVQSCHLEDCCTKLHRGSRWLSVDVSWPCSAPGPDPGHWGLVTCHGSVSPRVGVDSGHGRGLFVVSTSQTKNPAGYYVLTILILFSQILAICLDTT